MIEKPKLMPLETAPYLYRVMVCGWSAPTKSVAGYWWYEEGCVDEGVAIGHDSATHWFPIILPDFPDGPAP